MTDNRSGFGQDRNPVDNTLDGRDDPNRGPLDRAANAITGGSGGISGAMHGDDPTRGPVDRTSNALDGRDDPNRGPLDRAANAMSGGFGGVSSTMHGDDPTRGPIDRTANALDGYDDPNRGPLDRASNGMTGATGGMATGASAYQSTDGSAYQSAGGVVSAMFDSEGEAQRAVADLRAAGVHEGALSIMTQSRGTMTTRDGEGTVVDEEHGNLLRGILGGGALGAGLGVAALAIPGVGPLVGLGAIAAAAVPQAMAAGAAFGVAAGSWNEMLAKHGVSDEDATYYGDRIKTGGILVTVDGGGEMARDILYRHGGHSASRVGTMR